MLLSYTPGKTHEKTTTHHAPRTTYTMTTRQLFAALLGVALLTMGVTDTLDPDMWWHLRTGEYILSEGIPRQDIFSFTVPDHEWITHEWLSEVIMWTVYDVAGWPGLLLGFSVVIAGTFWLVYRRSAGWPFLPAFIVLLAAIASLPLWGVRPQMFNMLFFATFIFTVESVQQDKWQPRTLWLLPVLTVVWVNLHSGYLLGVVLLAVYVVGALWDRWRSRPGTLPISTIRTLALVTVACFLAALLNPNGAKLWTYPFATLGSSAMQQYIIEWQSPDFHNVTFWPFAALLFLGLFSLLWTRPAGSDILLFFGTGAAGLLSARHIPLFAIASVPVIARALHFLLAMTSWAEWLDPPLRQTKPRPILLTLNVVLLLIAMFAGTVWVANTIIANDSKVAQVYPAGAVDYLVESGLAEEHGYNSYGWGGYLIWRGFPVYIDGRADVYGDDFIFHYLKALELQDDWQTPLDDFDVAYVLIERDRNLATLLRTSPAWLETYTDDLASIFIRND